MIKIKIVAAEYDKLQKKIKRSSILMMIGGLLKFVFKEKPVTSFGEMLDVIFFITAGILGIIISTKASILGFGQFIEWLDNDLRFKLKNQKSIQEINFNEILNIEIHLDNIICTTHKNGIVNLDISDFVDYGNRKIIKSNFEELKTIISKRIPQSL